MVNCKRTQIAPLSKKSKPVPRSEWIVVPDTHEGIVSMETYEAVQKLLPEVGGEPCKMDNRTLFSGKVFCGHCGYALKRLRGKYYYFTCLSQTYVSSERCITDRIYEYEVKEVVLAALKQAAELVLSIKGQMKTVNKRNSTEHDNISEQLIRLTGKEHQLTEQRARLFEGFAGGEISKEQYLELKTNLAVELEKIKTQKAECEIRTQSVVLVSESNPVIGLIEKLEKIQEVTPELAALVKRITIFDSERIEIQFAFADELSRLYALTETEKTDTED
jgi:hypothetical protein